MLFGMKTFVLDVCRRPSALKEALVNLRRLRLVSSIAVNVVLLEMWGGQRAVCKRQFIPILKARHHLDSSLA